MRLLLDTHALLWFLAGDESLSVAARQAIETAENEVLVSAASAFEVTTKHRLGKLPGAAVLALNFPATIQARGFLQLPISLSHAEAAGNLQISHKDPFDRLLIAQSLLEAIPLVSNEALFDGFGVNRLW
ncbi:MAG: type II toxin-antitoxin system VapC family toxin [Caulobacteraceae bacterium]